MDPVGIATCPLRTMREAPDALSGKRSFSVADLYRSERSVAEGPHPVARHPPSHQGIPDESLPGRRSLAAVGVQSHHHSKLIRDRSEAYVERQSTVVSGPKNVGRSDRFTRITEARSGCSPNSGNSTTGLLEQGEGLLERVL